MRRRRQNLRVRAPASPVEAAGASSAAPAKGKGQDRPASADEVPPRRRRRRSSAGEESVQAAPAVDASVSAEGSAGGRRRRHRASDEAGATSRAGGVRSASTAGEAAADVTPGRSRRRKHVASNDTAPQRSELQTRPVRAGSVASAPASPRPPLLPISLPRATSRFSAVVRVMGEVQRRKTVPPALLATLRMRPEAPPSLAS